MMYQDHQENIAYFGAYGSCRKSYVLVIIAYSKREPKQVRSHKGSNQAGGCIDSPAVFKNIDAQAQQERNEKEQALVPGKGIKKDEQYIQVRIYITCKIDIIQD